MHEDLLKRLQDATRDFNRAAAECAAAGLVVHVNVEKMMPSCGGHPCPRKLNVTKVTQELKLPQ